MYVCVCVYMSLRLLESVLAFEFLTFKFNTLYIYIYISPYMYIIVTRTSSAESAPMYIMHTFKKNIYVYVPPKTALYTSLRV